MRRSSCIARPVAARRKPHSRSKRLDTQTSTTSPEASQPGRKESIRRYPSIDSSQLATEGRRSSSSLSPCRIMRQTLQGSKVDGSFHAHDTLEHTESKSLPDVFRYARRRVPGTRSDRRCCESHQPWRWTEDRKLSGFPCG